MHRMARAKLTNGTPVHISIDASLVAWLDAQATERMVSRSYLITQALKLLAEQIPAAQGEVAA